MNAVDLERYLFDHIPLTETIGVVVIEASEERVVISAPLAPNINHRQTAFGGSISALATVAAWSWLHADSVRIGANVRLVIRSNRVEYLLPIEDEFIATCEAPSPEVYDAYHEGLRRRGKGRIEVGVTVSCRGQLAATFVGCFVAIRPDEA